MPLAAAVVRSRSKPWASLFPKAPAWRSALNGAASWWRTIAAKSSFCHSSGVVSSRFKNLRRCLAPLLKTAVLEFKSAISLTNGYAVFSFELSTLLPFRITDSRNSYPFPFLASPDSVRLSPISRSVERKSSSGAKLSLSALRNPYHFSARSQSRPHFRKLFTRPREKDQRRAPSSVRHSQTFPRFAGLELF